VTVEDTGPGIPADRRQLVFKPFYTTKPPGQGTGLGLSISAQIMAEFGGTLRCAEGRDGGAGFTAGLPPCPAEVTEPESVTALPPSVPGCRVLVVDDEPKLVQLMLRLLSEDGLIVSAATDARIALRKIAHEEFDLVITDLDLGQSKGTALMKAVKGSARPCAFLFVTGDVLNQSLAQELAALDVPVLSKPFLRTDFLRLVRRVLQQRRSPSGSSPV
jgi:CheY-like chemotaxis protein